MGTASISPYRRRLCWGWALLAGAGLGTIPACDGKNRQPVIESISPSEIQQGETATLTVRGRNFFDGVRVSLGSERAPDIERTWRVQVGSMDLEDVERQNDQAIIGHLRALLPTGDHDVTLWPPGRGATRLANALRVIGADSETDGEGDAAASGPRAETGVDASVGLGSSGSSGGGADAGNTGQDGGVSTRGPTGTPTDSGMPHGPDATPSCGNGMCTAGENPTNCPADCTACNGCSGDCAEACTGSSCDLACPANGCSCDFDCTASDLCGTVGNGNANVNTECTGVDACDLSCNGSAVCTLDCQDSGRCSADCDNTSACSIDCTGGEECELACDSSCRISCEEADDCDVDCGSADDCVVLCQGADTCHVNCSDAEDGCQLECAGAGTCQFTACDEDVVDCGGGTYVCDRPCP